MKAASIGEDRELARRQRPQFLFEYIDGGAYDEVTHRRNVADLQAVTLRQRVLCDVSEIDLSTALFEQPMALPVALGLIGLAGMSARRAEMTVAMALTGRTRVSGVTPGILGRQPALREDL